VAELYQVEFEGRARWGASFSTAYPAQEDNNGHGELF
jgi:hypothetical protein